MLKNTLTALLKVWGPTGQEVGVAEQLKKLLAGHVDSARTDALGNLIVEKKGQEGGKRIMLSAHMDHIGLIVTDVEDEGYLRVTNVGGLSVQGVRGRHVVFGSGVNGVCVCQPVKTGEPAMSDLFVDIGAESKEDALRRVNLGDVCVFAPDVFELGDHKLAGPAMDDRSACAVLAALLEELKEPKNTVIGVFSTQEEVGCRGATTAAYAINPDVGVALDVTAWGDTPETKLPAVKLGEGAAVKFMDRNMVATPSVRDALLKAAKTAKAKVQREVLPFGGTDGGAIQRTRDGIPSGTLSIPCRYVHSATEVIDLRDMESAVKILNAFVNMAL
jgi:endoglucanase